MKHRPAGKRWWLPRRLSVEDICQRSGYDRVTVWRKRQADQFPAPVVDGRRPMWDSKAIDVWLRSNHSPAWRETAERFRTRRDARSAAVGVSQRLDVLLLLLEMWDEDDEYRRSDEYRQTQATAHGH